MEIGPLPFVFYTATYTDKQDEEFALDLGADRMIRKPTEPDELIEMVRGVISDVQEGKLASGKPTIETQEEVFELYSRRLVKKLEKKVLDLEEAITERERAVEALRESEEYFRSVIENAQDLIAVLNPDGTVRYHSPSSEAVIGYRPEELVGKNVLDLVHPEDRADIAQEITRAFAKPGTTYSVSYRLRHKDGSWRVMESTGSTYVPKDGPTRGVVNSRDVTEKLDIIKQMCEAQRMEAVGRLASGVAHDFNNCLTVILSYGGFLRDGFREGDPARDDALAIVEAGETAAKLTVQLLTFSRRQIQRLEDFELNRVVDDLQKMLRRLIGEDIDLVVRPAAEHGFVRADEAQIEQILMNLAVNAREAMPDGGRLLIETANVEIGGGDEQVGETDLPPGRYVQLRVSDNGSGMDEETRLHVFEPFFTTKEDGRGTGLGLSTVYGIVQQTGGYIRLHSELGQGTTFEIHLPRVEGGMETRSRPVQESPRRGTETVLLVEDAAEVRKLTRRMLESHGYQVLVASNGEEALLVAERHAGAIDLLLTDVVMPRMGGRELADRLAVLRPQIRVVYMSGYADDGVIRQSVVVEGVSFVQKPFTGDDLLREIRQVLDSS